ncbi:MAG: hypothetical protein R2845_00020 [Thermomicrobiales bacterium]
MRVRALDGALPLVGASLLEYPDWRKGGSTLLADLAGRRARIGSARDFTKRASERLGHPVQNPLTENRLEPEVLSRANGGGVDRIRTAYGPN